MANSPKRFTAIGVSVAVAVFIVVFGLTWFHLKVTFTGLSAPAGQDIAQVARNVASGRGYVTQALRPAAMRQLADQKVNYDVNAFPDTHNPPGAVVPVAGVLAAAGLGNLDWDGRIYRGDLAVATMSSVFFLISVCLIFALVSGLFDRGIASFVAGIMVLSEIYWGFVKSGLPQMWLLMLFSGLLLALFQHLAVVEQGKKGWGWLIVASVLLGVLGISEWVCLWLVPGFCAFLFFHTVGGRAKSMVCAGVVLLIVGPWMIRMLGLTGSPFGVSYYEIRALLAGHSEAQILGNYDAPLVQGAVSKILRSSFYQAIHQINHLSLLLGMGPAAMMFFLALLQTFRRQRIATFRWLMLYLWLGALFGMSVVGFSDDTEDGRQIHLLFAPVFTAYGLALLSLLWSRLEVAARPGFRYGPHVLLVLLAALPPLGYIFDGINFVLLLGERLPPTTGQLVRDVRDMTEQNDLVLADEPATVAWYAGRTSMLLPPNLEQLDKAKAVVGSLKVGGLLFTESTTSVKPTEGLRDDGKKEWMLLAQSVFQQILPRETLDKEKFTMHQPMSRVFNGRIVYFTDQTHFKALMKDSFDQNAAVKGLVEGRAGAKAEQVKEPGGPGKSDVLPGVAAPPSPPLLTPEETQPKSPTADEAAGLPAVDTFAPGVPVEETATDLSLPEAAGASGTR